MKWPRFVIRTGSWCAAALAIALAAVSWVRATGTARVETRSTSLAPPDMVREIATVTDFEAELAARNPFRVARAPTQLRFGEAFVEATTTDERIAALGAVRVGGVVGGPPWAVLLEGIPGHETGLLLTEADTVYGIVLKDIRSDTVILAAFDTIVRLTPIPRWR